MYKNALPRRLIFVFGCLMLIAVISANAFSQPMSATLLNTDDFLVPDGDFEDDPTTIWSQLSNTPCDNWIIDDDLVGGAPNAYSGNRYFFGGGVCDVNGDVFVNSNHAEQTLTVDTVDNLLSFWYYSIRFGADSPVTDDFAYVEVNGNREWEIPLIFSENTNGWANVTVDLSAYANQSVSLRFGVDNGIETGVGHVFFDFIEFQSGTPIELGIDLSKTPNEQTVSAGGTAEFTITIENIGNVSLFDVVVEDPLAPESCGFEEELLLPEQIVTHNCEIAGVQASFTNTASVTANDGTTNTISDSDSADVTVTNPDIEIVITPDTQTIPANGTASFSMTVTNTGTETLTNIVINSEDVDDCDGINLGQITSENSKTRTCEATNVTQSFLNTVTVTGKDGNGDDVVDDDSAFVDVMESDLVVVIEADLTAVPKGEKTEFTVFLFNLGQSTLNNISISDPLAPDCNETINRLNAGDNTFYKCFSEPVTEAFNNVITATANGVSDTDVIEIEMLDLQVSAVASPKNLPFPGGVVDVSVTIRNIGTIPMELVDIEAIFSQGETDPNPLQLFNSSCETAVTLSVNRDYDCSFEVSLSDGSGQYDLDISAVAEDEDGTSVTGEDSEKITINSPAVRTIFLSAMLNDFKLGEPNDTCGNALPLDTNFTYKYLPDDVNDWYTFTTTSTSNLTVELTNFVPVNGQILVYLGTCNDATFLQNNGDFSMTKIVSLGSQPAGTYLIWIINDGPMNDDVPYNLIIRDQ